MLKEAEAAYGIRHVALRYFNAVGADPDGELGELHLPETHLSLDPILVFYEMSCFSNSSISARYPAFLAALTVEKNTEDCATGVPGAINLPPPRVRKLAPDFNHHRKVGLLVLNKVHATEPMTNLCGFASERLLTNLSADRQFLYAYNINREV